ncbi:hypothetical protein KORDIASMS9_04025 [Kordia sp. SMS9]|uniref:hypothetical protein n=1 Tax=Kordia sp. SMS9 TaxID=2282170 RepID=UPI000E0DF70C|nr:hypothetical protein [Kordia sp. SMS9]AXG71767.1 hypothetical protein KORDIASMS9_04025 [Kordia sp. SMS9]
MKKLFIIFSFLFVIIGCNDSGEISSEKEFLIINNCLNYIKEKSKRDCYLINPKFYSFDISEYSNSEDKYLKEYFKSKSKKQIQKIESDIDKKYLSKYSQELDDLSSCEESNNIIGFSGISDEIVIVYQSYYHNKITKKQLQKGDDKQRPMEYQYFIFFIDKMGDIKYVIDEGSVIFG